MSTTDPTDQPLDPPKVWVPVPLPPPQVLSDERRRAILGMAIANSVRTGWKVESQSDFQAVLMTGKRPNHILHMIITFFTCLLWAPVWIVVTLTVKEVRTVATVDPYGNVLWQ